MKISRSVLLVGLLTCLAGAIGCRASPPSPVLTSSQIESLDIATLAKSDSTFDALLLPFANEAQRRRAESAKNDPEYAARIDRDLNRDRINFLLFGYGETHEPPLTEKAIIGSHTIISYDLKNRQADLISLTHDIRAPEIERELEKRGYKRQAVRLDQAYNVGGFRLMRRVLEDATGLAMDFQIAFRDAAMQPLIDDVFGGVVVDVPIAFEVHAFYLDGVKYDPGKFAKGRQKLNGRQVIQFIKTVPVSDAAYDRSLEHNARKHLIFNALLDALDRQSADRSFWLRGSAYITGQLATGAITFDFDPISMLVNNLSSIANISASSQNARLPQIRKTIYIVDPAQGDGGVQWINANAAMNPITQRDIAAGVYAALDTAIPFDANPYGNLVTEYWQSVRAVVKQSLTRAAP
jgi:hypothetical protein